MELCKYKQALELKELGFDEKTDVWRQHGEGISGDVEGKKDYWNRKGNVYTAIPTLSQAFRWFRDKHGLVATFEYSNVSKWTYKILEFTDTKTTPNIYYGDYGKERTYEEAEQDCLVELIDFVKMNIKQKFRKKPIEIEAVKFTRNNWNQVKSFTNNTAHTLTIENRIKGIATCIIPTLEGHHIATEGDWIIKDIKGEFYLCKPDIFEATYEAVSD